MQFCLLLTGIIVCVLFLYTHTLMQNVCSDRCMCTVSFSFSLTLAHTRTRTHSHTHTHISSLQLLKTVFVLLGDSAVLMAFLYWVYTQLGPIPQRLTSSLSLSFSTSLSPFLCYHLCLPLCLASILSSHSDNERVVELLQAIKEKSVTLDTIRHATHPLCKSPPAQLSGKEQATSIRCLHVYVY